MLTHPFRNRASAKAAHLIGPTRGARSVPVSLTTMKIGRRRGAPPRVPSFACCLAFSNPTTPALLHYRRAPQAQYSAEAYTDDGSAGGTHAEGPADRPSPADSRNPGGQGASGGVPDTARALDSMMAAMRSRSVALHRKHVSREGARGLRGSPGQAATTSPGQVVGQASEAETPPAATSGRGGEDTRGAMGGAGSGAGPVAGSNPKVRSMLEEAERRAQERVKVLLESLHDVSSSGGGKGRDGGSRRGRGEPVPVEMFDGPQGGVEVSLGLVVSCLMAPKGVSRQFLLG